MMRIMTCANCGKTYDSPRGRTTCSEICRKAVQYEKNRKRTPEYMRVGALCRCPVCNKAFTRTGIGQKYCSQKCQAYNANKAARAKVRKVDAVCVICGAKFKTTASTMARTCQMSCTLKLRSQLAKARNGDSKRGDDSFCMPCPWANHKLDTLPPGVTTWDDPIMDPLGCGTAKVMLKFETEEKRRKAA